MKVKLELPDNFYQLPQNEQEQVVIKAIAHQNQPNQTETVFQTLKKDNSHETANLEERTKQLQITNLALENERNILRTLINAIPDSIFIKDIEGRYLIYNQAFAKICGVSLNEMIGKTDFEVPRVLSEAKAQEYKTMDDVVFTKGVSITKENSYKNQKGETCWSSTSKVPFTNEMGEILGIVGIARDITAVKRSQEKILNLNRELEDRVKDRTQALQDNVAELDQERNLLSGIINNFPDFIYAKDKEHRFVIVNEALAFALNEPVKENLIGKTDYDYFTKEEADSYHEVEDQVMIQGTPIFNYEELATVKNNEVWHSSTKVPWYDTQGNIIGLIGIGRDITEERKAKGKIIELNSILEKHIADLETANKKLQLEVAERKRAEAKIKEKNQLIEEQNYTLEERVVQRTADLAASLKQTQETERALAKSEKRIFNFLETMPIGVFVMDKEGNPYYANHNAQAILGRGIIPSASPNNDQKPINEVYQAYLTGTHDLYPTAEMPIIRALEGISSSIADMDIHQEQKVIPLEVHAAPIFHPESEEVDFAIATFQDITKRRHLEKQLRQAQKMEALGTLAGGIAHDFNNILTIILGSAEALMQKLPEGDVGKRPLERIVESGKRAANLVRQILTFSRMDVAQLKSIHLASVIEESLEMARSTIPANIEIQKNFKADNVHIMGDLTQIQQIIFNLCSNAHHAMEETGGTIKVSLKQDDSLILNHHKGGSVQLKIGDSGSGISQEDQEKIFDPFFTTKVVGKGTGLGLSVVHGIVERHQGHISVESKLGKGTTFSILLPIIEDPQKNVVSEEKPKKIVQDPVEEPTTERGRRSILLVEDESAISTLYKDILEMEGYRVTTCNNGASAYTLFQERPNEFDLIYTDQAMPSMTGKQLAKAVMEIRPDLPIILSTGFSEVMSAEEAKKMGIRKYLVKPVLIPSLLETIKECLNVE